MPGPRKVLSAGDTIGVEFNVLIERAFILFADLPDGAVARLQIQDPDGGWRDVSAGDGVRFDEEDFDEDVDNPGAMKFFYAAPGQTYRLVATAAGGQAWLLYGEPQPGLRQTP